MMPHGTVGPPLITGRRFGTWRVILMSNGRLKHLGTVDSWATCLLDRSETQEACLVEEG